MAHPLLSMLHEAATGRFPEVDGGATFLPPFDDGREAVVAFTGHAVVASRLAEDAFADLELDGFGGALHPEVLLRLANGGTVGVNDVTLVARGTGPDPAALSPTELWSDHHRVRHAVGLRADVAVYGDESGFVTLAAGLAGRREMGVEIAEELQGSQTGRRLIEAARRLVGSDDWLFAAVSPGNARSLRSFLSQGFVPIGSEVIITPSP